MHFTTMLLTSLNLAAISISPITALGINCDGSPLCAYADWNNKNASTTIEILDDAINQSNKSDTTSYKNGEHIICIGVNQTISIDGPKEKVPLAKDPEAGLLELPFSLDADLQTGGICLFPQDMPPGASLTLGKAKPLVAALLDHGCGVCGSVPIDFVNGDNNSSPDGILTFNYVGGNVSCSGDCIGSDISDSPGEPEKVPVENPGGNPEGSSAATELTNGAENSQNTPHSGTASTTTESTKDNSGDETDSPAEDIVPPIPRKRLARFVHL